MWSWFRLENEQLHNTEGYRRVDFVPLHFDNDGDKSAAKKKEKTSTKSRVSYEVALLIAVVIVLTVVSILTGSI
jgi:hypothetical protein